MDDDKIVTLFWKREERAVSETMDKYGKLFYSLVFGLLRRHEDTEECVNDTYVRLWNNIPPEQPDNLGAYGCRVARNLALDRIKAESREKRAHSQVVLDELAECIPSGESADGIVNSVAVSRAITRFLSTQSPQKRIIFMRRYFYMDTSRDIAVLLHVTEASVKMTLSRMRKKFREYLKKEGIEE